MLKKDVIIFAGYRSWSIEVFNEAKEKYNNFNWYIANSENELNDLLQIQNIKLVILAGWSWIIPREVVENNFMIGFHPSDLPNYAGGSPIQNQILDGVNKTKMTLFKLDAKIDNGEVLLKEDLDLSGGIDCIFKNLVKSSLVLLDRLFIAYPNIELIPQEGKGKKCMRLKPSDSKLTFDKIKGMSVKQIYNFIRCREEPYPNAYIEDDMGILYFKKVNFIAKEE